MDTRQRVRMLLSKHFVTPIQRSLVHRLSPIIAPLLSRIPASVAENARPLLKKAPTASACQCSLLWTRSLRCLCKEFRRREGPILRKGMPVVPTRQAFDRSTPRNVRHQVAHPGSCRNTHQLNQRQQHLLRLYSRFPTTIMK